MLAFRLELLLLKLREEESPALKVLLGETKPVANDLTAMKRVRDRECMVWIYDDTERLWENNW